MRAMEEADSWIGILSARIDDEILSIVTAALGVLPGQRAVDWIEYHMLAASEVVWRPTEEEPALWG